MTSPVPNRRWSVILPYVNERDFIAGTLLSLCNQSMKNFELILVDNASTDDTEGLCRTVLEKFPEIPVQYLYEARPGKTHALETGVAASAARFVATCDADTIYPPHYLALCDHLFETGGEETAAVMALDIYGGADAVRWRLSRRFKVLVSNCLPRQAHTGGYGQTFRLDALRRAGGFSVERWPYVLEDHEIMHRLFRLGRSRYHPSLWCRPSTRRADRTSVNWTLTERLLYHATPYAKKDWFFYEFLARRMKARGQEAISLRVDRCWEDPELAVQDSPVQNPGPQQRGEHQRDKVKGHHHRARRQE